MFRASSVRSADNRARAASGGFRRHQHQLPGSNSLTQTGALQKTVLLSHRDHIIDCRCCGIAVRVKHHDFVKTKGIKLPGKDLQRKAVSRHHMTILTRPRQPRQFQMAKRHVGNMTHGLHQLRQQHKIVHVAQSNRPDAHQTGGRR